VGTKFPILETLTRNHNVFTCISGEKTCLLEALLIANDEKEYKNLKGRSQRIIPKICQQYIDLFNEPTPQNSEGCEMTNTLTLAAEKCNLKCIIYAMKDDEGKDVKYEQVEIIGVANGRIVNCLRLSCKAEIHICYIKDIEGLTKCHIYPKCNSYMLTAGDKNNYHKEYFKKNVDESIFINNWLNNLFKDV
jgi:hypothetical protein